jgi:hypothetical protein
VIHQVQQAARSGDDDVGATAQRHHLRIDGYAAEDDDCLGRPRHVAGIESNRFPYLCGEFPCGDEYQGANTKRRVAIAVQRLLQKWQSEGSCLA